MRTSEAVTEADGIWFSFALVLLLYAAIGTIAIMSPARHVAPLARGRRRPRGHPLRPADRKQERPMGLKCAYMASVLVPSAGGLRVTRADLCAVILWVGATFYALFGGADFGGGFWDLVAGGAERGERPRALIQRSLTPVWEANHVWLIFILVVLWTAFPPAFSAVMTTLYVPIALAAVGIVLRGSGFAFRKSIEGLAGRRAAGATFADLLAADARSSWAPWSARSPPATCRATAMARPSPAGWSRCRC